jgi:rhodanese-related sulfurtransferase
MEMAAEIDRERVQALARAGASLVEVLPQSDYEPGHLPGAINIPLVAIERGAAEQLARDRPVIVYCFDNQ